MKSAMHSVVESISMFSLGKETKIFDPADGFSPLTNADTITDSSVVKRGNRWWMYLAGKALDHPAIQLFSASLPEGAPLSASGWTLTPEENNPARIALLAGQRISQSWDLKGGRHCPSYVCGWDPQRSAWVERIYYAGGSENVWGPYTIGYLEWDGTAWLDQPAPVFSAIEDWEHGSVYEPNLIYHDGKWKMWYAAGSNQQDYIVHGYAESPDGRANWTKRDIFFPPDGKVFDFCVFKRNNMFEAVFSRVWLAQSPTPPTTGLWWCESKTPSSRISDWSNPIQIMTAEDRGWHSGPWKPSPQYSESDPTKLFVFFDGVYMLKKASAFPFAFTLGCLELTRSK
jgi:hypothetical protein